MSNLIPWTQLLRSWQAAAFRAYREWTEKNFLLVATPGAGKTLVALRIAYWFLQEHPNGRIVVVVPSSHLRRQWARAGHKMGIHLDPTWENQDCSETQDFHGMVITYQAVNSSPLLHRKHSSSRPTLVIFDEIHHAGDDLGWGQALRTAFEPSVRRLALSGTPFRSDNNKIPFVNYQDGVSVPSFSYGYQDALLDGEVVRAVLFPHFEGQMEWLDNGVPYQKTFADDLNAAGQSRRLRTALMPTGNWLRNIISEANEKLLELRTNGHADAGGLIVAMDQDHARRIADLMREMAEDETIDPPARALLRNPVVVTSDDPKATDRISSFEPSAEPWIIAVRMISEGVDISRLRVGVYASNVVTELFFRQVVGRLLRWILGLREQTAYLYIPADARLVEFARKIQEERDHFLDEASEDEETPRQSQGDDDGSSSRPSFFMPVDASNPVPQGVIHQGCLLPHEEVQEARTLLARIAGMVPEHLLVEVYRSARQHFGASAPAAAQPATTPASGVHETPRHHARDAAKGVRNERVKTLAGLILRTAKPNAGIGDLCHLINTKLLEHSGSPVGQLTIAQLREQQDLLVSWATGFSQAAREGRAAIWLERWEEGTL